LTRAAHTLKSNSAMPGANELAEICLRLEKAGKEGQLDGLQPDINGLQTAHALVCQELKKRLEKIE
jgi:HPt (histidine-containing phosphotransfer) domain-containing protein